MRRYSGNPARRWSRVPAKFNHSQEKFSKVKSYSSTVGDEDTPKPGGSGAITYAGRSLPHPAGFE